MAKKIKLIKFSWAWSSTYEVAYCLRRLSLSSWIYYPLTIDCPTKSRYHFRWKPFAYYEALEKERVIDINQVTKKSCTNVHITSHLKIHVKALQTVNMLNGGGHTLGRTSDKIREKRNPSISWHLMNKWTFSSSERRLFS